MARAKWTQVAPEQRLSSLLKDIGEACTISESAQRVMALTRAGDVSLVGVVDAVMKDPGLATEVLRLANSPLFGQTRQVHDLKRAVVVVGMQELHNIAAAISMMAAFSSTDELSSRLRETAVLSASIARLVARRIGGIDESQAFLSGLLCEIGAMACVAVDTQPYKRIWFDSGGMFDKRAALESGRYTVSSERIGGEVLKAKQLPDAVAAAIAGAPQGDGDLLTPLTSFARRATPLVVEAANREAPEIINDVVPGIYDSLGLPPMSRAELVGILVQSATMAELSLRGEINLVDADGDSSSGGNPVAQEDPAAFEIKEIALAETEARRTLALETAALSKPESIRLGASRQGASRRSTGGLLLALGVSVGFAALAYLLFVLFFGA